jgi:hypothetical protein
MEAFLADIKMDIYLCGGGVWEIQQSHNTRCKLFEAICWGDKSQLIKPERQRSFVPEKSCER